MASGVIADRAAAFILISALVWARGAFEDADRRFTRSLVRFRVNAPREVNVVGKSQLIQIRQQLDKPADVVTGRLVLNWALRVHDAWGKHFEGHLVVLDGDSNLCQVVLARRSTGRFPSLLDGWQEQRNQNRNDGDDDQ